ncbi:ABC transporter permease [Kribbella yunnanensis]|uniref:ABC transporter permease n=1 Tax=Kribbella yunnanensis TaxID=190194 RepID=A0ABN2IWA7_9ACTN
MSTGIQVDQAAVGATPYRRRLSIVVPLAFLCVAALLVMATLGSLLAPQDPTAQDLLSAAAAPGAGHLLGTDSLGRDILSRVLVGARPALIGPLAVAAGAVILAVLLGLLAGFNGGWIETLIVRIGDLMYALPGLLVLIVVAGLFGGGYWVAVVLMIILVSPAGMRLVRSAVLTQRNLPYIEAAQTLGVNKTRLMLRHILPNVVPTVVAMFLLDFVGGLVALSTLSFLGVGSPPGSADWGLMLAENRPLLDQNPWAAIAPALLLIIAAFSVTILGDWLHARLEKGRSARD